MNRDPLARRPRPHTPQRPLWLCRRCAHPWPCGQAKIDLLRELAIDRTYLRIYLASYMHEALRDLCALTPYEMPTPAEVWDRFLAWAAPPTAAGSSSTAAGPPPTAAGPPPRAFRTLPRRRSI